jgi:hypothetical protein
VPADQHPRRALAIGTNGRSAGVSFPVFMRVNTVGGTYVRERPNLTSRVIRHIIQVGDFCVCYRVICSTYAHSGHDRAGH